MEVPGTAGGASEGGGASEEAGRSPVDDVLARLASLAAFSLATLTIIFRFFAHG